MENLHSEIGNIVEMVRFWTGSMYVNLQHFDKKVWTRVFLPAFGPCYTFDLSKVGTLKHISFETGKRFGIEFAMAENHLWQKTELILHTKFDLPDASQFNGFLTLSFSDQIKQAHRIDIRKKINKRESTRLVPCVKYEYLTCKSIEDNTLLFERFHCIIPILYNGQHLDDFIPKDASNCSYEFMMEAFDFISEKESNCSLSQTCENVRFTSNHKVEDTWLANKTVVYVTFENPEVEYQHSYISYDLISLIGEIGGVKIIADFKTSNGPYSSVFPDKGDRMGFGGWRKFNKCAQQMAAYRLALEERTGYHCDVALIIVSTPETSQAIFIDSDQLDLQEARFLKRCKQFHDLDNEAEDSSKQELLEQTEPACA